MTPRIFLNTGLLLMFAVLAFIIYQQTRTPQQLSVSRYLDSDTTTNSINKIVLTRQSGTISFNLIHQQWFMTAPYNIKAHAPRIKHLLSLLASPVTQNYPLNDVDITKFGFTNNQENNTVLSGVNIRFNDTFIYIGHLHPINHERYIIIHDRLLLVQEEVSPLINAQATGFIDLGLLPTDSDSLSLKTQYRDMSRLSAEQLESISLNWQSAQAFAVHQYLPRKQLGRCVVADQHNNITFEISDDEPWLILGRSDLGIEYHLDIAYRDKLFGTPDA